MLDLFNNNKLYLYRLKKNTKRFTGKKKTVKKKKKEK